EFSGGRSLAVFRAVRGFGLFSCLTILHPSNSPGSHRKAEKEQLPMAYFYEIRSADNTVLKRDGGFASQDAAKMAAREDAKKMKNMRQPDRPNVGRIMVG